MEITQVKTEIGANRQRRLLFVGAKNFRDLGGHRTLDGMSVRWGVLFRSDSLHKLTDADLRKFKSLNIGTVVDFRAEHETERKPDRIPEGVRLVKLPMEDSSTKVWHEAREDMVKNMRTLDPAEYMIRTNVELATKFTPGYRRFFREVLSSNGNPLLFHCAAGKDRTGFAAAVTMRILGVHMDAVMQDYMLTDRYLLDAYKWNLWVGSLLKGRRFTNGIRGFMKADARYLSAAFDALEAEHGSFDGYVREGLSLTGADVDRLKGSLLE